MRSQGLHNTIIEPSKLCPFFGKEWEVWVNERKRKDILLLCSRRRKTLLFFGKSCSQYYIKFRLCPPLSSTFFVHDRLHFILKRQGNTVPPKLWRVNILDFENKYSFPNRALWYALYTYFFSVTKNTSTILLSLWCQCRNMQQRGN